MLKSLVPVPLPPQSAACRHAARTNELEVGRDAGCCRGLQHLKSPSDIFGPNSEDSLLMFDLG